MPQIDRPPFENCLHVLWSASELTHAPRLDPPLPFNAELIAPLLAVRRRFHFNVNRYVAAMGQIAAVNVESAQAHERSIALLGFMNEGLPPQLAFDLARDERQRILGCRIFVLPAMPGDSETVQPRYEVASIPQAIFAADMANQLGANFASDARIPEVHALAHGAGATVLNAALRHGD